MESIELSSWLKANLFLSWCFWIYWRKGNKKSCRPGMRGTCRQLSRCLSGCHLLSLTDLILRIQQTHQKPHLPKFLKYWWSARRRAFLVFTAVFTVYMARTWNPQQVYSHWPFLSKFIVEAAESAGSLCFSTHLVWYSFHALSKLFDSVLNDGYYMI